MTCTEEKIFNNSVLYMKSLVGKKVEVETYENISYTGVVYVVDPIYKTIVLHINRQSLQKYETVFILHHAIKSIKVLSDDVEESYIRKIKEKELSSDVPEKKNLLKKWLQHMFINVTESGDYLKIDDHLVIVPPYGPENCVCSNTIILDRIQKMISLMPSEFT